MFESSVIAEPLRAELVRLRVDGRRRSVAELVALVQQCQSIANQTAALQVLAMTHLAAIEDVELEDGTVVEQHRGLGHQRLDAPALVSDQLGLSDAAATSRMTSAVEIVTRAPVVHEAMASGRLDAYRAGVVCEELRDADPEVCREVTTRIEGTLGTEPPAALRRRVRRVLGAVDADLVRAKAARARAARSLRRWPGDEPGVDTWMGSFPVEQARSGWAVIDGLARQYVRDGRASGVDEARADALMDLIHSRAKGTFVVQLAVPADRRASHQSSAPQTGRTTAPPEPVTGPVTGPGEDDGLVTVMGLGMPGETVVRSAWLRSLPDCSGGPDGSGGPDNSVGPDNSNGPDASGPAVVACHADTGALLATARRPGDDPRVDRRRGRSTESQAYRPPPALVELVKTRDGRCRFPGCTVSAVFCDLDHVRPWPSGPTEAGNLMCLCRRHHRIKQTVRWRVRIDPDATVTWTDPSGRRRTTLPIDFLQLDRTRQHRDPSEERQASVDPSCPTELSRSDGRDGSPSSVRTPSPATRRREQQPCDEVGVLWSAWEDELSHDLARAERNRRRRPRRTLRLSCLFLHGPPASRHEGPRSRSERAGADGLPPF